MIAPIVRPDRTSVYAQYTVMTPQRDRLQDELKRRGIPIAVHYPVPLHKQPAYARYGSGSLAVSESVAAQVISLPMYADLQSETQRSIVGAIREALV